MTDTSLVAELTALVRASAKLPPTRPIDPEARLVEDLGIDSLDLVGVYLSIQDRFGVEIDEADVPSLARVADLALYITARRPSAAA